MTAPHEDDLKRIHDQKLETHEATAPRLTRARVSLFEICRMSADSLADAHACRARHLEKSSCSKMRLVEPPHGRKMGADLKMFAIVLLFREQQLQKRFAYDDGS